MTIEFIKDTNFKKASGNIKPDAKRRIVLPKINTLPDVTYQIYTNSLGQIVLDSQVTIPASEAWLYANEEAISAVRRGLQEAAQGKISKLDLDTL